jgi:hypothetical protein
MTEIVDAKSYICERIAQANAVSISSRDAFKKKNFSSENQDNLDILNKFIEDKGYSFSSMICIF